MDCFLSRMMLLSLKTITYNDGFYMHFIDPLSMIFHTMFDK
jgi:hypothetical protein